ncbi:AAA family ATPase [Amycolatopsis sp. NBC_00345]|uniref:helix-turn-helix transcriptional regulator n=1 Tax=Amycolatopsis sp. NBC_00345 TaxID=2975955 RepID=UPI002E264486
METVAAGRVNPPQESRLRAATDVPRGPGAVTPLVGRDAEFAVLADAINAAAAGRGGGVLVCGQPGIGKSRLAAEAVGLARAKGFTVVEGRADPLLSGLAYAPIVQAFRDHLSAPAGLGAESPELGVLFPGLRPEPPSTGDPALQRTRMYESVLAVTRRLAARNPVLLFLDDVHCADRGTVELLYYIGRNSGDLPVVVLACFRSGVANEAITAMAAATRRDPSGRLLELAPLTDRAVSELVGHLLGAPPSLALLRAVTSRASGIALFAVALTRHLATGRMSGPLPEVIRDVVLEQVDLLGDTERRLLEVVAVAGVHGRAPVLGTVAGLDSPVLHAALRRLVGTRLVVEHRSGAEPHYQIAHPLYAEAVYGELGVAERRALHAAVGVALDATGEGSTVASAPHYAAGGDSVPAARAVEVFSDAGRRALTVGDLDEAGDYLTAALRRARGARPEAVPALLVDLARVEQGRGRLGEAAALLDAAVTLGERRGQDAERLRAWRHLQALLEAERGNVQTAVGLARASGRRPDTDPPMRLMIHWIIALRDVDIPELALVSKELAELPSTHDTPVGRAVAGLGAGVLAALSGDLATASAELAGALELASRCGGDAPHVAFPIRMMLNGLAAVRGDLATAIRVADVDSTAPVRLWLPAATCYLETMLATTRYLAGDVVLALSHLDHAVAEARRVGGDRLESRTLAMRSFLRAERGDLDGADADLTGARRHYDPEQVDLKDAVELAATALALRRGVPAEAPPLTGTLPFGDVQLNCLRTAFAGYAAVHAGDLAEADRVTGLLRAAGRNAPVPDALADLQQGLTASARGARAEAAELVRGAVTALRAMGMKLLAAHAELALAGLVPRSESAEPASSARAVFDAVGSSPFPARGTRPAPRAGVLTRRESEITALLGQGLSNAEIAGRLFLSERTVETHLRNVYRKLGLKSRVSLAQWAR